MQRVPEPELMDDPTQARAYAYADFETPHNHFIELFCERLGEPRGGLVLDLGCGPGDICRRFIRRFPNCRIDAVDGSAAMLALGKELDTETGLNNRIQYIQAFLPGPGLPNSPYRTIISNSLLHHLDQADTLWSSIRHNAAQGAAIFVMDLLRPVSVEAAEALVRQHADGEPEVLRHDFYHSLLAAYTLDEIRAQLARQQLDHLTLERVSDRHCIVWGHL